MRSVSLKTFVEKPLKSRSDYVSEVEQLDRAHVDRLKIAIRSFPAPPIAGPFIDVVKFRSKPLLQKTQALG